MQPLPPRVVQRPKTSDASFDPSRGSPGAAVSWAPEVRARMVHSSWEARRKPWGPRFNGRMRTGRYGKGYEVEAWASMRVEQEVRGWVWGRVQDLLLWFTVGFKGSRQVLHRGCGHGFGNL